MYKIQSWNVELDYNIHEPAHPFRPHGVTIGHLLEWSRLTLNARNALLARGEEPPAWMLDDAASLYEASKTRGWSVDGAAGFVYTTNFSDAPVVRERLHWVCCEAIAAAWALYEASGDEKYRADYDEYWAYALEHLVDHERGGWIHELSPTNEPSELVWWGKPDLYHAYQAVSYTHLDVYKRQVRGRCCGNVPARRARSRRPVAAAGPN